METIHWNDFRWGLKSAHTHDMEPQVWAKNQFVSAKNIHIQPNYWLCSAYSVLWTVDLDRYVFKNAYVDYQWTFLFNGRHGTHGEDRTYCRKDGNLHDIGSFTFDSVETVPVASYTPTDSWGFYDKKQYVFSENSVFVYDAFFHNKEKTVQAAYDRVNCTLKVQDSILVASKNWVYEFKLDTESFSPGKVITDIPHGHIIKYMYFSNDVLSVLTEWEWITHIYQFQASISGWQYKYDAIYKVILQYSEVVTAIGHNNSLYIIFWNGDVHMVTWYQTQKIYKFQRSHLTRISGTGYNATFFLKEWVLFLAGKDRLFRIDISDSWRVVPILDMDIFGAYNGYLVWTLLYRREYNSDHSYRDYKGTSFFIIELGSWRYPRNSEVVSNDFFDSFSEKKEIEGIDVFYEINYSGISSYKDESRGVYTRPVTIEVYIEFPYLERTFEQMESKENIWKIRRSVKVAAIQESNTNKVRITGKEIRDALARERYDNNFTNFAIKLVINNGGCRLYRSLKDRGEELWTNTAIIYGVDIHYNITDYEQK